MEEKNTHASNEETTEGIQKNSNAKENGGNSQSGTMQKSQEENCLKRKGLAKKIALISIPVVAVVAIVIIALGNSFAHTHAFGDWKKISDSTCSSEGVEERFCSCGEKQERLISKINHTYGEWFVIEETTCVKTGVEKSECIECGDALTRIIPITEHNYGEWKVIVSPTCENTGLSERVCTVCEDKKTESVNAIGHSYSSWNTTVDVSCTNDGNREKICANCNDKISEVIKATGHVLGTWVTVKDATCTNDGSKKRDCSKCDYSNTETIKATGHIMSAATCTTPKTCINCKATEGKALGHINLNGYCSRCNIKITIDMNTKVGHPDECKTTKFFGFCYYKNSADGIKVCWGGENLSGKTINYYTVTVYFYNSVGDPAYSEITGKSSKTVKYVGPIKPNEDLIIFGIVDYVPACSKIVIGDITLEYSDGTSDTGWYGWSTTYRNSSIK